MRDTGERFECGCGEVFQGPGAKIKFLAHQTTCSKGSDNVVIITPITHHNLMGCRVAVYNDSYKLFSFKICPGTVSQAQKIIRAFKKAEVFVESEEGG